MHFNSHHALSQFEAIHLINASPFVFRWQWQLTMHLEQQLQLKLCNSRSVRETWQNIKRSSRLLTNKVQQQLLGCALFICASSVLLCSTDHLKSPNHVSMARTFHLHLPLTPSNLIFAAISSQSILILKINFLTHTIWVHAAPPRSGSVPKNLSFFSVHWLPIHR